MRKGIATFALAVGLGAGGAAVLTPTLAQAQDPGTTSSDSTATSRVDRIEEALRSLVTDGSITQEQADEVATTLADRLPGGRGGHGHGHGPHAGRLAPEAVAGALGVTTDELRTALQEGRTLAQVAEDEGVSRADLIGKLVAAAEAQLAEDVQAGRVTQAQADQLSQDLEARITEKIDRVGHRHGPRGGGDRDAGGGTGTGTGSGTRGSSSSSTPTAGARLGA